MLRRILQAQEHRFTRLIATAEPSQPRPFELIRIVERAMARDPADRHVRVEDLAGDLRRFLHGGGGPALRVAVVALQVAIAPSGEALGAAVLVTGEPFGVLKVPFIVE